MKLTQRIINAIRGVNGAPKPGRFIEPRPQDALRDYPAANLTPSRLIAILREADSGSLSAAMQLFEEMEEKDAHLFSVANTRRLALTGLEWQIVSAADVHEGLDAAAAADAAAWCRQVLVSLEEFDEVLQHLSLAVGRNIALAEIVWDVSQGHHRPVSIVPIDFTRILFDELDRIRILTQDEPRDGIAPVPFKFIVHTPHSVSGHPQRGGLLRVSAMVYLAKNLALKDWMIFSELFGMPVRVARYDASATPDEKRELLRMLETLGTHATAIFSRGVELQLLEANRGTSGPPYERFIEFLNREMSKAWLGQTLTTDTAGQRAALATSQVHELVRQDILTDDVRREGRTIRRDLLTPLTRLRFGPDAPVPYFRRKTAKPRDPNRLAEMLSVAVNELGLSVPAGWAHDSMGIPRSPDRVDVVPGTAH